MLIHERYQHFGGEDHMVSVEQQLLDQAGIQTRLILADNAEIDPARVGVKDALNAMWSFRSQQKIARAVLEFSPDIIHVHNTFPILSPAILWTGRKMGIPVVQTLHNYRLLCVNALLSRNETSCELCVGRAVAWPGIRYGCYRSSRKASAAVAAINLLHGMLGTWSRCVSRFIALSPFSRLRFIQGGLPAEKIIVRPNPVPDPGPQRAAWHPSRHGAVFVGRLSGEKGIMTLISAWRDMAYPLTIIGDGPLMAQARAEASSDVRFTGFASSGEVSQILSQAALLVAPSTCYENCPTTIGEAMAHGVPVVCSDLGTMPDMVVHGQTGYLVPPNDPQALRHGILSMLAERQKLVDFAMAGRSRYEQYLHPDVAGRNLVQLYDGLINRPRAGSGR